MGFELDLLDPQKPIPADTMFLMVDVDLKNPDMLSRLRAFRKVSQRGSDLVIAIGKNDLQDELQATALGAKKPIVKPISEKSIATYIEQRRTASGMTGKTATAAAEIGAKAIKDSFDEFKNDTAIDVDKISEAGRNIAASIADLGISEWLSTVRIYHQSTFQHILLVTGIACAFAQNTGMSKADIAKLTQAGLLHDVGKVSIPDAILDKPGKLTAEEFDIVKRHPVDGFNKLNAQGNIDASILHGVRHHHEYLDGSGYPDGLTADQIPDLTRILTICDIMGALLEERSYKPRFSVAKSIEILKEMGKEGKLERALVLALETVMKKPGSTRSNLSKLANPSS
ncbi:MAG: HD domain-containing protein [Thalassospira sp.]|uniref:HD-GYP domain-containing protein n=1 Tax=Thalassospira sp. TaxID=1912094 RepID=UPI0032EAA41C